MAEKALSPETDKRFVDAVLARGLADAGVVARVAEDHRRAGAIGPRTRSLAQHLCDRGVLDRSTAARLLQELRAGRAGAKKDARRIGKYVITGELGRGGMGVVYKAYDTSVRREVALKMILEAAGVDLEDRMRFAREARAAAKVPHPGIVQVYEAGVLDGKPYIAMELVEGESFEALLKAKEPVTPRRIAEIVRGVADALQHAHEQGVIHRDVKPQNILIDRAGRPHLADFGLARDAAATAQLTLSGTILGTPAYLAPEQARGDSRAQGPHTDVYALGAILYRALVGRPPFEATSPNALIMKVCLEEPAPPRRIRPQVHPDLETIALRCLAKEPGRRYPSAGEVAADLGRFLDGEAIHARPIGPVERSLRWAKRNRLVVALVVAVVAAPPIAVWQVLRRYAEADRQARALARKARLDALEAELQGLDNDFDEVSLGMNTSRLTAVVRATNLARQCAMLDRADEDARRIQAGACVLAQRAAEVALDEDDFPFAHEALQAALGVSMAPAPILEKLGTIERVSATSVHTRFATALARIHYARVRGDVAEVLAACEEAKTINERAFTPWLALSVQSLENQDLAAALDQVNRAIRLREAPRALEHRVEVHRARGDLASALADAEKLLARKDYLKFHVLRMYVLDDLGRFEDALREAERIESSPRRDAFLVTLVPQSVAAFWRCVATARGNARHDDAGALAALDKAVEAWPTDIARLLRGFAYIKRGDRDAARADIRAYFEKPDPRQPALNELGRRTLDDLEHGRR